MELKTQFKQSEIGLLPFDWEVKLLDDVVVFNNGKAHEKFISDDGEFIVVNSKFISTSGKIYKKSLHNLSPLKKDDITMVMSDIPNGKALAKCYLIEKDNKYTLNQRICSFTVKNDSPNYLLRVLNRNKYFLAFDSGTGQTNLRRSEVLNCKIPIPKISEQIAISNALSDIDLYINSIEKLIQKKFYIKVGIMQELFKPKDDWENVELGEISQITMGQSPSSGYYNLNNDVK